MLRLLDNIWFGIKDRLQGYDSGYNDGFKAGLEVYAGELERRVAAQNPHLSNPTFQLGYDHAVKVMRGEVNLQFQADQK